MIDPYRMVVVNIIASLIVFFGVLIYRFIYPKKKINLFVLLLIISLLPCLSLLRAGDYESGDFNIHIYRSIDFFHSLIEGNILPSWAGNLNAGYGYPLFIFNYTLPYYIVSLIHLIGNSFINSLKIYVFLNIIFTATFAYTFGKNHFQNNLAAFVVGIFYTFFPYHLIALHFKVTVGEILAYTLIPLFFYFLDKYIKKGETIQIVSAAILLGLIALSHIFIAIFLAPITFFYLVILGKNKKISILAFFSIFSGALLISLYQWLPQFIYKPYLYTSNVSVDISHTFSLGIQDLLFSPWRFGLLFQGPQGQISYLVGYAQILSIAGIIFFLLKKKIKSNNAHLILFWLIIGFILLSLMTEPAKIFWQYFPILNGAGVQRLLILIGLITSIIAGYICITLKNKYFVYLLILFCILITILNWGQRRVIPQITDNNLMNNLPLSTSQGEGHYYAATIYQDPKNLWMDKIPKESIDVLNGNLNYKLISRNTTKHIYEIKSMNQTKIRENTLFFPGWIATSNGNNLSIYPDKKGLINIDLPKGNYTLTLQYNDTSSLNLAKKISVLSLLAFLLFIIIRGRKLRNFPKL